jgi:ZIP family zinc transporter
MDLPPPSPNTELGQHDGLVWEQSNAFNAMLMSLIAGMSTGLGGCVVCCFSAVSPRVLAFTLALAGGVMTSVSILELMKPMLSGEAAPLLWASFGAALYSLLRTALPESSGGGSGAFSTEKREDDAPQSPEGGSERRVDKSETRDSKRWKARQWRLGVLMMVTLTAHNLPEGVAVAVGGKTRLNT